MTVEIKTRGLDSLVAYFEKLPERADRAAVIAVNEGARFGRADGARRIRDQVAFKASYLNENERFTVAKRATSTSPEAVIRGRERPTSLATFVQGARTPGRKKPRVKVSAGGSATRMPGAWLMRLNRGGSMDAENFNVGLAIRLKPGQKLDKRVMARPVAKNVYLLYGPSVAQVFRDVARDIQGPVSTRVEAEFVRQMERSK